MSTRISFLDLPREVRDIIYRDLLVSSIPQRRVKLGRLPRGASPDPKYSIFRLSNQISAESFETFYGENYFDVEADEVMFKAVKDYQILRMRDVRFLWTHSVSVPVMEMWRRRLGRVWKSGSDDGVKVDGRWHGGIWVRQGRRKGGRWVEGPMFGIL